MTPTGACDLKEALGTIEACWKVKTVMFLKMQGISLWGNSVCWWVEVQDQGDLSLSENVPECLIGSLALS